MFVWQYVVGLTRATYNSEQMQPENQGPFEDQLAFEYCRVGSTDFLTVSLSKLPSS